MSKLRMPVLFAGTALMLAANGPALAAHRFHHHHHASLAPAEPPAAGSRDPDQFYPNKIDGGVSGNLPFNNQIRKMKDPLNANGAGK